MLTDVIYSITRTCIYFEETITCICTGDTENICKDTKKPHHYIFAMGNFFICAAQQGLYSTFTGVTYRGINILLSGTIYCNNKVMITL
jgi:hypothetical protein